MKIETTKILENAVLFSLTRHSWGNRAVGDKTKIKTSEDTQADEATKKRMKLSNVLIAECPELDAIYKHLNEQYQWCIDRSMYSCLRDGVYFVSRLPINGDPNHTMVTEFEKHLAAANTQTAYLLKRFLDDRLDENLQDGKTAYELAIAKAESELNGQFDRNNYPSVEVMRSKFGLSWSWLEFNVPKDLPEDVKAREKEKLERKFADAAEEVVYGLREAFGGFVEDLRRRLETDPNTPGKRFTAPGAVDNLKDFVERFHALNFANDAELASLVSKAKEVIEGSDAARLKQSQSARSRFKAQFAALNDALAPLIADRPKRKVTLE